MRQTDEARGREPELPSPSEAGLEPRILAFPPAPCTSRSTLPQGSRGGCDLEASLGQGEVVERNV